MALDGTVQLVAGGQVFRQGPQTGLHLGCTKQVGAGRWRSSAGLCMGGMTGGFAGGEGQRHNRQVNVSGFDFQQRPTPDHEIPCQQ